jgi:uncharacterized membrane protein
MEAHAVHRLNRSMTTVTGEHPGLQALTFATALGCGLVAGVFFAFSTFVMSGLGRLPAPQAVAAMQSINVTAVRPMFMIALFGTAVATVPLIVAGIRDRDQAPGLLLILGGALYLVGTIGVTMAYNVPRNNALSALDPASAAAVAMWPDFLVSWVRGNHLRTLSSLGAAAAFTLALLRS